MNNKYLRMIMAIFRRCCLDPLWAQQLLKMAATCIWSFCHVKMNFEYSHSTNSNKWVYILFTCCTLMVITPSLGGEGVAAQHFEVWWPSVPDDNDPQPSEESLLSVGERLHPKTRYRMYASTCNSLESLIGWIQVTANLAVMQRTLCHLPRAQGNRVLA